MLKLLDTHIRPLLVIALLCLLPAVGFAQDTDVQQLPAKTMYFARNGKLLATLQVETARTTEERMRGLMFRTSLAEDAGMLFLFEPPQNARMWMKNTLIPLDMVFIDATHHVVHIHPNAVPHDLTPIGSGQNVWAVLELKGGVAARMGLQTGDTFYTERKD